MPRAALPDVEIEYALTGHGEDVVFVHHGIGVDWFAPLCEEPALAERYRLLRYHRAGYGDSGGLAGPLTFEGEAATFRALMRHLGIARAHVVGHSSSACMALQIAWEAPDVVQSLGLLEPALMGVPSPPEVPRALELYRAGDTAAAVETFLRGTCGPQARTVLDRVMPGAMPQALADADTFFGHELPALRQWTFGPDRAQRITQPALAVLGENSDARFQQRQELLRAWLPNVEPFLLLDAGHLLHLENPQGLAGGLADFFARHPDHDGP